MSAPAKRARDAHDLAREAARLTLTKRAEDVTILDLRELEGVCDFFVLATGHSEVQVRAIADAVEEGLGLHGEKPWHTEGYEARRWILLDYVDVVVHVFHAKAREYYLLDKLWGDARRELVTD
ncbi:MAG TPA: ribosome silencing factor [Candidatus Eisenbacteria bacterium]|nr:ribosome silencing factor [Candidatus Eisenbacteria bacterium]